jgi:hypothetical protein
MPEVPPAGSNISPPKTGGRKAAGSCLFDNREMENAIGKVRRLIDEEAEARGRLDLHKCMIEGWDYTYGVWNEILKARG